MRFLCCQLTYYFTLWSLLWAATLQAKPSLVKQAIAAFEKEAFAQAKAHIDQAMDEETTQAQGGAWYYRGVIYEKLLRDQVATEEAPQLFEATLAAYHKALALTPAATSQYHSFTQINLNGLWAYYLDRGRRYYRQEAFENAIQQFNYCQQIKPEEPWAYLYTAIAAHQEGHYELALTNYEHYLEKASTAPAAVFRGLAHLTAGLHKDPQEALKILEQALLQYPFDNNLLYEQLQLYTALGQVEALQKLLHQKIATAPHEAAFYYQLGYWYEQQGQEEPALEHYQKAAERVLKRIEPIRQQGIVHYNQAAQLTQAIKEMPNETFQELGTEQIKQLRTYLEQAFSCFKQANKINPRDPFTLKHLQNIYVRLRRPDQADKIARLLRKYRL